MRCGIGMAKATQSLFPTRHGFQVIGVDALAVPAQVVELETFGDRTHHKLVGDSVRPDSSSVPIALVEPSVTVVA